MRITQTVRLTGGTVVLRAWGAHVVDAYLLDLLTLTATLGMMREQWQEFTGGDVEPQIWASFHRLVDASLDGTPLPAPLSWADVLNILTVLWELNDLDAAEGKLAALRNRAASMLTRLTTQGHPSPMTSTSSLNLV